jgi:hypothetical protein
VFGTLLCAISIELAVTFFDDGLASPTAVDAAAAIKLARTHGGYAPYTKRLWHK